MLSVEDREFLSKRRRLTPGLRLFGWLLVITSIGVGAGLCAYVDRLNRMLRSGIERSHAKLIANQTISEREVRCAAELRRQELMSVELIRWSVLAVGGFSLVGLLTHGISLVGSAVDQRKYLAMIDRLTAQRG